jgi:hypothetical protein
MSTPSNENNRPVEDLLGRYRLSAPSVELKNRVMRSAQEAWNTCEPRSEEVSWRLPLFRFAASIALTLLLVRLANNEAHRAITRWEPLSPEPAVTYDETLLPPERMAPFAAITTIQAKKSQIKQFQAHIRLLQSLSNTAADAILERLNQTS